MLPQQRFEVEVDAESMPRRAAESESATYLLQAGSFRQAEDADRRRAELLLLGLQPRVEETNGSNGRWYRVLLGPFDSRSKMAAARSLTAQQNIDTLLLKRG
jgi:cell division protein FtsN